MEPGKEEDGRELHQYMSSASRAVPGAGENTVLYSREEALLQCRAGTGEVHQASGLDRGNTTGWEISGEGTNKSHFVVFWEVVSFLYLPLPHTNAPRYLGLTHTFGSTFIMITFSLGRVFKPRMLQKYPQKHTSGLLFIKQPKTASRTNGPKGAFSLMAVIIADVDLEA